MDRQGAYRPQPALARPVLPCLPPGWVGVFVRDLLFGKEICTEKHGHRRRGGIVSVKACHAVKARDQILNFGFIEGLSPQPFRTQGPSA